MKIVIDISENMIEEIENNRFGKDRNDSIILAYAVMRRITLPKGHGRLIDADALKHEIEQWKNSLHSYGESLEVAIDEIEIAPTIIEADKEVE